MREIKFRGKRTDNGEWVYGWLTPSISSKDIKPLICVIYKDSKGKILGFETFEVTTETVGQFTGLKDKNGKEIYEGDEVAFLDGSNESGVVEWDDESASVQVSNRSSIHSYEVYDEFQIIGNIHDNKK